MSGGTIRILLALRSATIACTFSTIIATSGGVKDEEGQKTQ
ncbi:6051_t:CDS:2, partial [Rhizophagus irregularis]